MSALMAAHAASLTAAGAGKSGNPCDRLTPPYMWLSRVISRMTDSVNCVAFLDPVSFDIVEPCYAAFLARRSAFFFTGAFFFVAAGAFLAAAVACSGLAATS